MIRSSIARATCATVVAATLGIRGGDAAEVEQIQRYCQTSWQRAGVAQHDWSECTQEVFAELLDRISRERLSRAILEKNSDERRELKRSVWCVIQRRRRSARFRSLPFDVLENQRPSGSVRDESDLAEFTEQLETALGELSVVQQQVMKLWSHGARIGEIANELDLPAPRVSDEKYKALTKLRQHFGCRWS